MDKDFILAREAQLVYSNSAASGFSPVGDSLARWQGTLTYTTNRGQNRFVFEVFLPEYFPNVPPVVMAVGWMDHPNIDEDNFVQLRILENWRAEFHLYQVIIALKNLMSRVPPTPRGEIAKSVRDTVAKLTPITPLTSEKASSPETDALRTELNTLNQLIRERDEELAHLRAQQVVRVQSSDESSRTSLSVRDTLESDRIATSELLASLEDRYSAGEISIFEYSRLYKKYIKELFIIKKQLEFLG